MVPNDLIRFRVFLLSYLGFGLSLRRAGCGDDDWDHGHI